MVEHDFICWHRLFVHQWLWSKRLDSLTSGNEGGKRPLISASQFLSQALFNKLMRFPDVECPNLSCSFFNSILVNITSAVGHPTYKCPFLNLTRIVVFDGRWVNVLWYSSELQPCLRCRSRPIIKGTSCCTMSVSNSRNDVTPTGMRTFATPSEPAIPFPKRTKEELL